MHGLEREYWGKVDFIYLDVENRNNWSVMRERFAGSSTIPRFYILAPDGQVLYTWVGVKSANEMRGMLDWTVQQYPTEYRRDEQSAQQAVEFFLKAMRAWQIVR